MIYNFLPKIRVRHEGFSFYGLRKSDEQTNTEIIFNNN